MPRLFPIQPVCYRTPKGRDLSPCIAPPYDVLDADSKSQLLAGCEHNIVAIDLPHLPAKTVGPDETYEQAGRRYRSWLDQGVLERGEKPALFVYSQLYDHGGRQFDRRGLIANIAVQPFGPGPDGAGGILAHEQTFAGAKEDRLKLMRTTRAQLSPIFGIYSDPQQQVVAMLQQVMDQREPDMVATTADDGVQHRLWRIEQPDRIEAFQQALHAIDVFIADGHHRYTTAINYREEVGPGTGADYCMFVLVAMQDPGMIILPTHRVLGAMGNFSIEKLRQAAAGRLDIRPFPGDDLAALERALPEAGHHAMGLYSRPDDASAGPQLHIATTTQGDPLAATHGDHSEAWRQLDVAICQHLLVEGICQPAFQPDGEITWKFPHDLDELRAMVDAGDYQIGVIMQPTPLEAVMAVSAAGELMPQKSTFFYPKLATGLVVNPLD